MRRPSRTTAIALAAGAGAVLLLTGAAFAVVATDVRVVNTVAEPVPVTEVRKHQVTVRVYLSSAATTSSENLTVAPGTAFVVENLAGRGGAPGVQVVLVSQFAGTAVLPVTRTTTTWKWVGTTPTKFVILPGNAILRVFRAASATCASGCGGSNYITLTGYMTTL